MTPRTGNHTHAPARRADSLAAMRALVSPYGLVGRTGNTLGEPRIPIGVSFLGELGEVFPRLSGWHRSVATDGNFDGAGGDLDPERAELLSAAESLERYAALAVREDLLITASADELGPDAVAPSEWPRPSAAEFATPRFPLTRPDDRGRLQWVRAWSLTRERPRYVPARMVWLRLAPGGPAESFTLGNSSGSAAHVDYPRAVLGGLLEVIERDALMLTWLHRLRLPRLAASARDLPPSLRPYAERSHEAGLETLIFDATTDFGVPAFFGLQLADDDRLLAQVVATTAGLDPAAATAKIHRELAMLRTALRSSAPPDGADTILDGACGGALVNGALAARKNFDFLLEGPRPIRSFADLPGPGTDDPVRQLAWVVSRLHDAGAEVLAVDITPVEARATGTVVVKVLVPQAMPITFGTTVRLLGTPRLATAPATMNHPVRPEHRLNPLPQPMA
ncbi:YcaO-like family protein [Amycolatopsis coloradensis]|uniref:YcaO-like family protein n=1 Tax=Amycolatopsis coloradensis TaxID=76021 RepID=A0ACD5BDC6_9PSEU